MGQNSSRELFVVEDHKTDVICEVFSHGIVHACNKVKRYLAFDDPQSKLCPSTDTLIEVFLVNFITFCVEKGVEERISTCRMSKQQALLLGVDWIWTLFGPDKLLRFQIAVQAFQMGDLAASPGAAGTRGSCSLFSSNRELRLADELYCSKSRFEKLEEFCALVGRDCLGLFIVFGLPGKPKDIRGVLLDSVSKEKRQGQLSGESALQQFLLGTDDFLPTREMLENCLAAKNGSRHDSKVYINFL